jgi:hypothetical protein
MYCGDADVWPPDLFYNNIIRLLSSPFGVDPPNFFPGGMVTIIQQGTSPLRGLVRRSI